MAMVISPADVAKVRSRNSIAWKFRIANALKENNGLTHEELFELTRPGDVVADPKASISSELTYLRRLNYLIEVSEGKIWLLGVPIRDPETKETMIEVVPGMEERVKALLG